MSRKLDQGSVPDRSRTTGEKSTVEASQLVSALAASIQKWTPTDRRSSLLRRQVRLCGVREPSFPVFAHLRFKGSAQCQRPELRVSVHNNCKPMLSGAPASPGLAQAYILAGPPPSPNTTCLYTSKPLLSPTPQSAPTDASTSLIRPLPLAPPQPQDNSTSREVRRVVQACTLTSCHASCYACG